MRGPSQFGVWSAACAALLLGAAGVWAGGPAGCADGACTAGASCGNHRSGWPIHCPKPFKWFSEGPPRLHFKHACPRPVCDPCTLEHFGYFATCWSPWPYPPAWSHCPTPPPGAVMPPPAYPPYTPKRTAPPTYMPTTAVPAQELPAPSRAVPPMNPGVRPMR